MPTYDYQCDACDHTWELFQNITEDPIKKCPACGKKKARRLFGTGAALMFKGSGFYETDYRSESYKKSAQAESKSSESASKSSDATSKSSDSSSKSSESTSKSDKSSSSSSSSSGTSDKPKSETKKRSRPSSES